jgi:hypothetical protein
LTAPADFDVLDFGALETVFFKIVAWLSQLSLIVTINSVGNGSSNLASIL